MFSVKRLCICMLGWLAVDSYRNRKISSNFPSSLYDGIFLVGGRGGGVRPCTECYNITYPYQMKPGILVD